MQARSHLVLSASEYPKLLILPKYAYNPRTTGHKFPKLAYLRIWHTMLAVITIACISYTMANVFFRIVLAVLFPTSVPEEDDGIPSAEAIHKRANLLRMVK